MVSVGQPARITYTNYRGETAERTITPKRVWFGVTDWHPEPQWFLTAFDHDKNADRDFALKDFGYSAPMASELERKEAFLKVWFDAPENIHWAHGMSNGVEKDISDTFDRAIAAWNTRPAPAATDTGLVKTPRDTACTIVDAIHRYTWEFSPNPTAHKEQYDLVEKLINDLLAVTRSQAEELLAAERAQTERWHKKAMDAGVITHSNGTTSHPMRKERDELKAKLAAAEKALEEVRAKGVRLEKEANACQDVGASLEAKIRIKICDEIRAVLGGRPS